MSNLRLPGTFIDPLKADQLVRQLDRHEGAALIARLGLSTREIEQITAISNERQMPIVLVVRALVIASLEAMGERLD